MNRSILKLLILLAGVAEVWGQSSSFTKQIEYINPSGVESVNAHRFAFGDIDNDGDPDMVTGEYQGRLIFYRNIGTAASPNWAQELGMCGYIDIPPITGPPFTAPHFCDVDGDADLDLVVGVRGSSTLNDIYFFRNVGTVNSPVWQEENTLIQISEGEMAVPFLIDLDNDADVDLIIGDVDGTLHYYRNIGDRQHPRWQEDVAFFLVPVYIDVGSNSSPTLGDVDHDGDFDLIIGAQNGTLSYFENIGTATQPGFSENKTILFGIDVGESANPTLVDLDGDYDLDLIIGNWERGIHFLQNTGSPNSPVWTINENFFRGIDVGFHSAPAVFDYNGDDLPDFVLGNKQSISQSLIFSYINNGTIDQPDWRHEIQAFPELRSIIERNITPTFVDLDDDDDQDFVSGAWDGRLYYFENTGSPGEPLWTFRPAIFLGIDVGNYSVPRFVDLDDDGDFDLTLGEINGSLTHFWNKGSVLTPVFDVGEPDTTIFDNIDVGSYSAPAFLDIDNDDDFDLIVGTGNGQLMLYENIGNRRNPVWTLRENFFQELDFDLDWFVIPTTYDLNKDGSDDLIIGEQSGTVKVYFNQRIEDERSGPTFGQFTPTSVYDTTSFYISIVIVDSQGVYDDDTGAGGKGVYLLWDDDGEIDLSANEVQLNSATGDTFQTIQKIPAQLRDATFVFRVFAYDNDLEGGNPATSTLFSIDIMDDDDHGPVFLYVYPDSVAANSAFYIEAGVADVSGFYDDQSTAQGQGAYLRWDIDGELTATYKELALSLINDNLLRTTTPIPAQKADVIVSYQMYLYDNDFDNFYKDDRRQSISPINHIHIISTQTVTDDDIESPTFSMFQTIPSVVFDTSLFHIQAKIEDFSSIYDDQTGAAGQGVHVRWDDDGELLQDFQEVTMSFIGDDSYRTDVRIPSQFWGNCMVYQLHAYDDDFDEHDPDDRTLGVSTLQTVTIIDDDNQAPEFEIILPPNIIMDTPFAIKAILTDQSGIYDDQPVGGAAGQGVYLLWDTDGELLNSAHEITMSPTTNDTFIVDQLIPGFPAGTRLFFNVTAHDNDFDNGVSADRLAAISNIRTVIFYDAGDTDIQGPDFRNWKPDAVFDDEAFFIYGEITDPAGVFDDENGSNGKGIYLLWDTDGELALTANEVQLHHISGDVYQTVQQIPAQPAGLEVIYQVFAYDNDINGGLLDRALGISPVYSVQINDDDDQAPQFSNFSPKSIYDSTTFFIECDITDTAGVYDEQTGSDGYGVYLLMDTDGELTVDATEVQMERFAGDRFRTIQTLRMPQKNANLVFKIFAFDADFDNQNPGDRKAGVSGKKEIAIYDDDNAGPEFSHFTPAEVKSGESYFIECDIADVSGVYDDATGADGQGVYLKWDSDGELEQSAHILQLSLLDSSRYRTIESLTAQIADDALVYRVYAHDNDYDNSYAPDRAVAASPLKLIKIIHTDDEFQFNQFGVAPNPFTDMIYFIFNLTRDAEIVIQLFTVSGERVLDIEGLYHHGSTAEISWAGINAAGNECATGVYLYRFVANDQYKKLEKTGKIAIVR